MSTERGALQVTHRAFTSCLLNSGIQLWPPDMPPGHGRHSWNSRLHKMELTNHCFSEIWRDDNSQSPLQAPSSTEFVTLYEVWFEIWITATVVVPTVLFEDQHLRECLVTGCVSCNLLDLYGVSYDLLGCNMENWILHACILLET